MYSLRRRILSQNFLHNRKLVKSLIRQSSIGNNDIVLEIGPGKGILTEQLIQTAKRVIAVELDTHLYSYLQNKFDGKISLHHQDFLHFNLPRHQYKVFANIPFSIEGKIIRKLLDAENPPADAYLVMRQDLAERLSGLYRECQFSISYKPWFDFEIRHYFQRTDFTPYARMDSVLFRFTFKHVSLLDKKSRREWMSFIGLGFGGGKNLKYNLRSCFTHEQFKRLAKYNDLRVDVNPSSLKLNQWIDLFKFYQNKV